MSYPPPPGPEDQPEQPPPPPPPPSPYGIPAPPTYGPGEYGQTYYGPPPPGVFYPGFTQQANQKALWAMITGILGLFCCGFASIVAIVLGSQAKKEIADANGGQSGAGQAQAGFVLGIVGCALWVLLVIAYVALVAVARSTVN